MAEARHIDLGVVGDGTDALVRVWDAELNSLLRNPVDNALRCAPPGGRVDVGLRDDLNNETIDISDTGPGIPAAERERVLDTFFGSLIPKQKVQDWGWQSSRLWPAAWVFR